MALQTHASGAVTESVRLVRHARVVRVVSATALVLSYLLTWNLWQGRINPPNLALISSFGLINFGIALLATALAAIVFPRPGAVAHSVVLLAAVLGDQVRLQPEFISLGILLACSAWPRVGLQVARWHVITLWGWAGLNKFLSAGWPSGGAAFIADSVGAIGMLDMFVILVPATEVGLAVLGIWRRSLPLLRVVAPLFHVQIVLILVVAEWNTAVWPWNLALAAAAPFLFHTDAERPQSSPSPQSPIPVIALATAMTIYPVGFYFALTDAYLAHNLYSSNTATAAICRTVGPSYSCNENVFSTWNELNVPLPPEKRLYVGWFNRICTSEEVLRVDGIWTHLSGRTVEYFPCPTNNRTSSALQAALNKRANASR